jgi:ESCRT-I complex subunit TSG101
MAIRPQHKHVDATGLCYLPYLSQWRADLSNLVGVVYNLITVFSYDPPVYATASSPILSPVTSPQTINHPTTTINPPPKPLTGTISVSPPPYSAHHTTNTNTNTKESDTKKLVTEQLINTYTAFSKDISESLSNQLKLQQQLEESSKYLTDILANGDNEKV